MVSISTSSPLLDDLCVIGGLPRGRMVQFYGPFGGGKTFLAMLAAKNALDSNPHDQVIWFDAENTFDFEWAEKVGIWFSALCTKNPETGKMVDRNRLHVYPMNDGTKIFKRITGEKKKDQRGKETKTIGILDMVLAGTLKCALIIIDSLAAIIPPGEDFAAVGKQNMALLPRFLPVEFRRMSVPLTQANVCLLCINQVTTNIGDQWGDKYGFSGGEKLKHWLSLNVFIDKVTAKEGKILTKKDDLETSIGQEIKFIIKKSKFGPYPRSCRSKVCFAAGKEYTGKVYDKIGIVDSEEEWIELGLHYGVITGSTWLAFEDGKYQGYANFTKAIKENPFILERIKQRIIEAKSQGALNDMHIADEAEINAILDEIDPDDDFEDVEEGAEE